MEYLDESDEEDEEEEEDDEEKEEEEEAAPPPTSKRVGFKVAFSHNNHTECILMIALNC